MSPWAWVAIGCGGLAVIVVVAFLALTFFAVKKGKEAFEEATGSESFQEMIQDLQDNPAKAAAKLAVGLNPELDVVSTDDEAGTMTIHNNKTGEEVTLNFEDIAEGRLSMTTSEGEYSIDASDAGDGADGGEGGVVFKGPDGEARFGAGANLDDVPDWVPVYPGASETQGTFHSTTGTGVMGAFTAKTTDTPQKVLDHFKQLFGDQGYEIGAESMTKTGDASFGAITGEQAGQGRSINVVIMESQGATSVTINYNEKKQ